MSGLLGALGFARSIVTNIFVPSSRYIVWPVTNDDGEPVPVSDEDNSQSTGSLVGYVPIAEDHRDELIITEHPVEQGAFITDHAYKAPAMLTLRLGWSTSMPSNNPLSIGNLTGIQALSAIPLPTYAGFWSTSDDSVINNIYATLLFLQRSRTLLTVATARRFYDNLLIQNLSLTTDEHTEHSLMITMALKEVILVNTQLITNAGINSNNNADPQNVNPPQPQGQQNLSPTTLPPHGTGGFIE